jgi:hypothetical protein
MLVSKIENLLKKVNLIDSICRLGVSYYFEDEINQVLEDIHKDFVQNGEITLKGNLHSISVLFRVLRQHGLYVSPGIYISTY